MTKIKKLILSLGVALTMLGAFVFGLVMCNKPLKNSIISRGGGYY